MLRAVAAEVAADRTSSHHTSDDTSGFMKMDERSYFLYERYPRIVGECFGATLLGYSSILEARLNVALPGPLTGS